MKVLEQALRQYRHNNSDSFVFGYDKTETDKIVSGLIDALGGLENQQEYQKHEFCHAIACKALVGNDRESCEAYVCHARVPGFIEWLKENGYRIVRITSGSG
jgi:hypothetical protein